MSLFVLSCKDGWVTIMYDGLDAVGVDQQVMVPCVRYTKNTFVVLIYIHPRSDYLFVDHFEGDSKS